MKKILLGLIALAVIIVGSIGATSQAQAARQHSLLHGISSQAGSFTVYNGWRCTGASDVVPRGMYADIDAGSMKLRKGYSLWVDLRPGPGTAWTLWSAKSTKDKCVTFTSMPWTKIQMVVRLGNKWGSG